jgi:hypothetical protein
MIDDQPLRPVQIMRLSSEKHALSLFIEVRDHYNEIQSFFAEYNQVPCVRE